MCVSSISNGEWRMANGEPKWNGASANIRLIYANNSMQLYKIKYIIVDSAHADMEALRCFNSIRNAKKKNPRQQGARGYRKVNVEFIGASFFQIGLT